MSSSLGSCLSVPRAGLALCSLLLASGCASWPQDAGREDPYPYPVPPPTDRAPAPPPQRLPPPSREPAPVYREPYPTRPRDPEPYPEPDTRPPVYEPPVVAEPEPPKPEPKAKPERKRPARKPATIALAQKANQQLDAGQLDDAAATLERALRIDGRDAELWRDLGRVRIEQGRAKQAEGVLQKSNSLAVGDTQLQAENWRLIAQARRMVGDRAGEREALSKARQLGG